VPARLRAGPLITRESTGSWPGQCVHDALCQMADAGHAHRSRHGTRSCRTATAPCWRDLEPMFDHAASVPAEWVWRVVRVSVLMMTGALGLFLWETSLGTDLETARTMAADAIVVAERFYLINCRRVLASALNRAGLTGNPVALWAIAACVPLQRAFTHWPVMPGIFGSADLDAGEWLKVLGAGLLVSGVAEVEKFVVRRTPWVRRLAAVTSLPVGRCGSLGFTPDRRLACVGQGGACVTVAPDLRRPRAPRPRAPGWPAPCRSSCRPCRRSRSTSRPRSPRRPPWARGRSAASSCR